MNYKLKGKKDDFEKTSFPAENDNSVFDSRFRDFCGVSVVADFRWLYAAKRLNNRKVLKSFCSEVK